MATSLSWGALVEEGGGGIDGDPLQTPTHGWQISAIARMPPTQEFVIDCAAKIFEAQSWIGGLLQTQTDILRNSEWNLANR